jgi:glycosyltransferase involved in cell wall biosynthesis
MRVVVVPSWYPSRDENDLSGVFFREQAVALMTHGVQVEVVTPDLTSLRKPGQALAHVRRRVSRWNEEVPTWRTSGVQWFPRLPALANRWWLDSAKLGFQAYIARNGVPDLVHCHCAVSAGALGMWAKSRFGVPYVLTEHSSGFSSNGYTAQELLSANVAYLASEANIAVSAPLAEDLAVRFPKTRWGVIGNVVPNRFFDVPISPTESTKELRLLHVSLLNENKRPKLLLDACARAQAMGIPVSLKIGGGSSARVAELQRYADSLVFTQKPSFLGGLSRSQVVAEMVECDVFVLMSRRETFGVVVAEAMAMGRPVLTTANGGGESQVSAETGIVVPVDNVEALTLGIHDMWARLRSFDGNLIREFSRKNYSEEAVSKKIISIYREALN